MKQKMMDEEMKGWQSPGTFVCSQCIIVDDLKDVVEFADSIKCDYCGTVSPDGTHIATSVDTILEHVLSALHFLYNHPAAELPYESREGGFQGVVYDTDDVVADLEITENDELLRDICASIDQDKWCERNYFSTPKHEVLIGSWESFCTIVKNKLRYLFLLPDACGSVPDEYMTPVATLLAISQALVQADLSEVLHKGSVVYRARVHDGSQPPDCARKLGTPSPDQAKFSGRLNPVGIPIFYGALEERTACVESAQSNPDLPCITVGGFRLTRPLTVIDLATPRKLPSIFDEERRGLRPAMRFLREFAQSVAQPVTKDEREHIDYVPTQIVSEYLRHYVGQKDWVSKMVGHDPVLERQEFGKALLKSLRAAFSATKFDGILYRSSLCPDGVCCGLFVDAAGCVDPCGEKEESARLVLDPRSLRTEAAYVHGTCGE